MLRFHIRLSTAVVVVCTLSMFLLGACRTEQPPREGTSFPADGRVLYETHCAGCHGLQGEGQPNWKVPNAEGVHPAPPHDSSGHTWHHPDALLLDIIAHGGSMPNSQMPAFADRMSEEEMQLTLDYIKTFWSEQDRAFQEQVTKQMQGDP